MSRWPTDLPIFLTDTGQLKLDERARFRKAGDFRNWQMLSKKSKIERLRKSREDQFFVVSAAASLCRACTRVCDRFCVIRYGPSRCHAWDAPAALKNFVRQPEETFFDSIGTNAKCRDVRNTSAMGEKVEAARTSFVIDPSRTSANNGDGGWQSTGSRIATRLWGNYAASRLTKDKRSCAHTKDNAVESSFMRMRVGSRRMFVS